jgi:hypothetical protein
MKRLVFSVLVGCFTLFATDGFAQTTGQIESLDISKYIPKNDQAFTKVAGSEVWHTVYRGKNISSITVGIYGFRQAGLPDIAILQVVVAAREDVPLSRNLAMKLLELNTVYDYVKTTLGHNSLLVRLDYPLGAIDPKRLNLLADTLASAADAIFGEVKNFIP